MSPQRLDALSRELARGPSAGPNAGPGAEGERTRAQRRARGVYFTPAPLVRFTVEETLGARLHTLDDAMWRDDGSPRLLILDPSAGDGRFLAAAADYLCAFAARRGFDPRCARTSIERHCLIGVERDSEFAALARERVPHATIHCRDALLDPPGLDRRHRPVDVVLGNPPYVRSIHMEPDERARLEARFQATSYGEWDVYAAFIEAAWDTLAPGGELGLIVPSRWLTASFARLLRDKLARARGVRALVDFGGDQVFVEATTYTSIVFLRRARVETVRVARRIRDAWTSMDLPADRLSETPWLVEVERERAGLAGVFTERRPDQITLGRVAHMAKGVGTSADRVFVLQRVISRHDGDLVRGYSRALGREVEVEAAITRVCVRGRDIQAYAPVPRQSHCIWPYDPAGALLEPEALAAFPRAAAYLAECRDALEARERGKYADPRYYRFGRPQNMRFMTDPAPKLVCPDVLRHGRATIDHTGAVLMDTAYALRLRPDAPAGHSLALIAAVFNAPILRAWLVLTGIPLRGGYVRAKPAYLESIPLPAPSEHTERVTALVHRYARDARPVPVAEVHQALRLAYGMDTDTWDQLAGY